jgi:hypothetical protein
MDQPDLPAEQAVDADKPIITARVTFSGPEDVIPDGYQGNDDDGDDGDDGDGDDEEDEAEGGETSGRLESSLEHTSGSVSITRDPAGRRRDRQPMTATEMAMWLSTVVRQTEAEEVALKLELAEGCYKQARNCLRCGLKPSKKKKKL